jgi:4a-hydroxytetrahydrobiopterin dehydratase
MKLQALSQTAPLRLTYQPARTSPSGTGDQFETSLPQPDLIKPMYPLVGGAIPEEKLPSLMESLPGWNLKRVDGLPRLEREIGFANFQEAMNFSNQVAEFAEVQGHHPTLLTEWGKVTVGWWTHDVAGVHANDFTSARRTDALLAR